MVYCGHCNKGIMILDDDLNGEHCTVCGYHSRFESCKERISLDQAADIWESRGRDDDYTFGFDLEELEDSL